MFTFVTALWIVVPVVFGGIDGALDPGRLRLLPLRRRELLGGLVATAFLTVPAVTTVAVIVAFVVPATTHGGLAGGAGALLAAATQATMCREHEPAVDGTQGHARAADSVIQSARDSGRRDDSAATRAPMRVPFGPVVRAARVGVAHLQPVASGG